MILTVYLHEPNLRLFVTHIAYNTSCSVTEFSNRDGGDNLLINLLLSIVWFLFFFGILYILVSLYVVVFSYLWYDMLVSFNAVRRLSVNSRAA